MRIAIVHTFRSLCLCHVAIEAACKRFGFESFRIDSEALPDELPPCDLVFEHASGYRGLADWRWYPRVWAEQCGGRLVGSPVPVIRLCDNKALTKMVLQSAGVPVPRGVVIGSAPAKEEASRWLAQHELTFPLVVKPTVEHGSTGLSLAQTIEQLIQGVALAVEATKGPALIEEYIEGREFELSILENWRGPEIPIVELCGLKGIYDTQKKATTMNEIVRSVAELDSSIRLTLLGLAETAMKALGGIAYMRFDIRLRGANPYFLEANAKPSFELGFGIDTAFHAIGLDVTDAIRHLIDEALPSRREASTS